jgi:hypothetical protein
MNVSIQLAIQGARVTYERVKEAPTRVNPSPGRSPPCPVSALGREGRGGDASRVPTAEGCVAC